MESVAVVFGLILAIPLWILYHKLFTVYYTDLLRGIMYELFGAAFTGIALSFILFSVLGNILGFFVRTLVTILKIVIPIILILAIIAVIGYFVGKKKS